MSGISWGIVSIILCVFGFVITYYFGTFFYTRLIHSASYLKLKASADALIAGKTEYEANVGISYAKSNANRIVDYNQYCFSRLQIKKDGLLFRPIFAKKFGLQFRNIVCINILNDKGYLRYPQIITITSLGNVNDKITIRTNKDTMLIDEIMRHYDGEIIDQAN